MKYNELTDEALDWAVAKCEGRVPNTLWYGDDYDGNQIPKAYRPSTDWAQGGLIIERGNIGLVCQQPDSTQRCAYYTMPDGEIFYYYGPTLLIAAMRCYVASKLGDEVDIPNNTTTNREGK